MDVIFYVVPGLIMVLALFMAHRVVRRWLQIRGAWNSGLTAEGRCLRTFTTVGGGHGDTSVRTTLHHVYEFIAHDGRVIRFEEDGGSATTVEGDYVTVYYTDGRQVVATAQAPSRARQAVSALGILAFLGVIVVFCAGFVTAYSQTFGPYGDFVFSVDSRTSVAP
ncbi:DUF3592 domain-containing protein [Streptomyces tuirus]|uniref:DUF3592 domain-containing protein n=1 Tax=Streptomyces tuirus TaxID=68278 RepID=A0A7G1NG60_9ACTN|nr:DUF3592 domain-containing protein [Streptomyces tuirus]BCL20707.1 hypothetical protein GCM10017668_25500 [Streptomyces tuirus]